MITLSRTILVAAEFPDENIVRFHGILEDHIYAMEIEMNVRVPEGVVDSINGWMKRYTNPICPQAVGALEKAVGASLREEGWMSRLNREIGRKGCTHFAEILIECGRCLDQALMARAVGQALEADPGADPNDVIEGWVKDHPEAKGVCLGRPS